MKKSELQQLRGIGEVLARRLTEAGIKDAAGVVAAGEEGLMKVGGIPQRLIPSVLSQAGELVAGAGKAASDRREKTRRDAELLREKVNGICVKVRDGMKDHVPGKKEKKVEREILKVMKALDRLDGTIEAKPRRSGKAVASAGSRLDFPPDAGLKKIAKGFRNARKSLGRVVT